MSIISNRVSFSDLVFVVDLNELDGGERLSISTDFTANFGPFVTAPVVEQASIGDSVVIIDDEGSLFDAEIVDVRSPRDMVVRVDWESERTQRNRQVNFVATSVPKRENVSFDYDSRVSYA